MKKWILASYESVELDSVSGDVDFRYRLPKINGCFCVVNNVLPYELSEQLRGYCNKELNETEWKSFSNEVFSYLKNKYDPRIKLLPGSKIFPLDFTPPRRELKFLWIVNGISSDCLIVHEDVADLILEKCKDDVFLKPVGSNYYLMKVLNLTPRPFGRIGRECPKCGEMRYKIINELQVKTETMNFRGHIAMIDTTGVILVSDEFKADLEKLESLNACFEEISESLVVVD